MLYNYDDTLYLALATMLAIIALVNCYPADDIVTIPRQSTNKPKVI